MKCLVTGGTGFIGSNVAEELIKQGHDVTIIGTKPHFLPKEVRKNAKIIQPGFLGINWDKIGKVDALFHLAGITDNQFRDWDEIHRANVESSRRIFEHVIQHGCKQIVYASSTSVYGLVQPPFREDGPVEPHNEYARSKLETEKIAKELGQKHPDVTFVGLRCCNVYGPREGHKGTLSTMIYQFAQQMRNGNPKLFKWGEQKRDYVYVKDVVRAYLLGAQMKQSCVVNCAGGKAVSFVELVNILNKVMGLNRTSEFIDSPLGTNYQAHTECDLTKAKEVLGFAPEFDIEKGIKDYYESGQLVPK